MSITRKDRNRAKAIMQQFEKDEAARMLTKRNPYQTIVEAQATETDMNTQTFKGRGMGRSATVEAQLLAEDDFLRMASEALKHYPIPPSPELDAALAVVRVQNVTREEFPFTLCEALAYIEGNPNAIKKGDRVV